MTIDERLWNGGSRGLLFGFVGGTLAGLIYAMDVVTTAHVAWTALLVHAYTIACLAGAAPMAAIEASRGHPLAPLVRVLTLIGTGALAGGFGATHIATLPDTPYPGPALVTATLGIAVLGFAMYAQDRERPFARRLCAALTPLALILPVLVVSRDVVAMIELDTLRVHAERLGLRGLGLLGGALAGSAVGGFVELGVLTGELIARMRQNSRRIDKTSPSGCDARSGAREGSSNKSSSRTWPAS